MPELPEVETIVRRLDEVLPGRSVGAASVPRENVVRGPVARFVEAVEGSTVERVERRAKFIVIRLGGDRVWITHLRMSGKYRFVPAAGDAETEGRELGDGSARVATGDASAETALEPDPAEAKYVRAVFELDDGARLLYVDPRTLGEMEVLDGAAWREKEATLGPEPLAEDFTAEVLLERLSATRREVKIALLDQSVVAGLGNIYVCEALWRARVSPRRRGVNVGPTRAGRIHRAIVEVLSEAVGKQGTSLGATYLNWADDRGESGGFYAFLDVYGREGEPCRRCEAEIRRIVQAQRSTWYCPGCQR
ncbi:MAG: bifunctional DNA-formamidopyrimidine glycosylase/DNA-(apurinic or apyrimidinic site) lyase [Gemmatimonadota bacterium]|nr:bifunctional DNA-formamidopyrimidine glycosylase/DNA-(apurinic or apyrimidinic site) lyase [Gemmatimonadota bacterium]